jgi:hypothetical protein
MRESSSYALRASEKQLKKNSVERGKRSECGIPLGVLKSVVRTEDQAGLYGGEYAGDGFPSKHAYWFA